MEGVDFGCQRLPAAHLRWRYTILRQAEHDADSRGSCGASASSDVDRVNIVLPVVVAGDGSANRVVDRQLGIA
jgi:hypothetical protein